MGLGCVQAESALAALQRMEAEPAELILADLEMGGRSGLDLLAEVERRWPLTEVALMGSYGSPENAVQARRLGAYDFVVKPSGWRSSSGCWSAWRKRPGWCRRTNCCGRGWKSWAATAGRASNAGRGRNKDGSRPGCLCTDLEELERMTVQRVFEQVGGDKEQAQKLLGISRATLYRKIKRYGIESRLAQNKAAGEYTSRPVCGLVSG